MGFKDYLAVITRRWYVFLPIVALVLGTHCYWIAYGQGQLFRSSTMILVSPPISGAELPGTRVITPLNRIETFRESPIFKISQELLTGERSFTSKVFEDTERQEKIQRFVDRFGENSGGAGPGARSLLEDLDGSIRINIGKDERLIMIEANSPDPDRAIAYSWAVAEAARIFHIDRCREMVSKTVAELQTQRQEFEKEREVALRDQVEFTKRTGLSNFLRYQEMVQGIVLSLDGEISQVRGQQRELERMIDERVSHSQQGSDELQAVALELGESARLKNLQGELLKTRLDHDIAVSRLTERHPTVADLRVKIDRMERLISDEQEAIVADGLKKWSVATRDLVKQSAGQALKIEVLKERKASLSRELIRLAELGQEYSRISEKAGVVSANLERVKGHINELEWLGLQAAGQVQVQAPSGDTRKVDRPGTTLGSITLSFMLACLVSLGVVYVLEYIDTRIKSEGDVRRFLGLPLLGVIPKNRQHLVIGDGAASEVAEKFNTAATLVKATARELGMKSFIVASSVAGEGKTTVSINLAASLARKGARVVLVDADLRSPRLHALLNLPNRTGLTTLLESQVDSARIIDEVLSDSERRGSRLGAVEALVETSTENLSVLTSGPSSQNPVALLESGRMRRVVKELTESADFVIFDTPPVNLVGDALTLADQVDGCVFVVGSGLCEQREVGWAKHLLANVQANLLGVFLNRHCGLRSGEGYSSYYQRSRSGEEQRGKRAKVQV